MSNANGVRRRSAVFLMEIAALKCRLLSSCRRLFNSWLCRCYLLLPLLLSLVLVLFFSSILPSPLDAIVDSSSSHLLCVLVPYRNRADELRTFAPFLHEFLTQQNIDHRLVILHQRDTFRFNRAALINVGYFEAKRLRCDYVCMHDVDLLPLNSKLDYGFPNDGPYHVASPVYHPRYHYEKFIGGILLMTIEHYKHVDGMSNQYWGWGLEDDEFYLRLRDANLTANLHRPINLVTDRSNTFRHLHDNRVRKRDYAKFFNQRQMFIGNASILMVNVALKCDLKWTPYCIDSTSIFS